MTVRIAIDGMADVGTRRASFAYRCVQSSWPLIFPAAWALTAGLEGSSGGHRAGTRVVEAAAARWMTVRSRCARLALVVQEAASLTGRAVIAVAGSPRSLRNRAPGGR